MKSVLEVTRSGMTSYNMDDYTFDLIMKIYDNYELLYHKPPSMEKAMSYLPQELQDTITRHQLPAGQPLKGQHAHIIEDIRRLTE